MADKVQGGVSFTPIVEIAADDDATAVKAIHHDIKSSLGGNLTYDFGAQDHWFYAPEAIATSTSTELICTNADPGLSGLVGGSGSHSSTSEAAGSDCHFTDNASTDIVGNADDIRFLFIKNTGTSNTAGTTTTNSVYITLDAGAATHNGSDAIEIAAGESWMGKINTVVSNIRIITGQANAAGTAATVNGSTSVKVTVAAVIDDGGHP
jgi:hypothetical protein